MRTLGQQAQHILRANDGKQPALRVAVDGGEDQRTTRLDQLRAGRHGGGRVRHVLQHLGAGDHVERCRRLGRQSLRRDGPIRHRATRLEQVQLSHLERLLGEIDAGHLCTAIDHRFRKNAPAAAHVQHGASGQRRALLDPAHTQRVDCVQRREFGVWVPPAASQRAEFGDLGWIDVNCAHAFDSFLLRWA